MNPTREKELFLQALEIEDSADREAFIADACEGDAELRDRVLSLLSTLDESPDRFEPERYASLDEERVSVQSLVAGEIRFLDQLGATRGEIGNYELLEEVGRGAMGIVFRARQPDLDREVALKVILNTGLASSDERQRFRLEAAAAARLEHPNIVPVHEVGISEEHDFYSMLLVQGGTLADRINKGTAMPPREAVGQLLKVVDAVEAAHEHGIIHRDLKPENILLNTEGEPMVSDFGLARLVEAEGGLTLSGQILGTPRYMAPEMVGDAEAASTRSDIYAIGAMLYEMLVGEPLFDGGSVLTTLRMVQEQAPVRPGLKVPGLDRDLETIVLKCLEKSPGDRYATARGLYRDLEAWLGHRPITARPVGPFERARKWMRRRPVHAALALLAVLFALLLGIGGPLVALQQGALRSAAERASAEADKARENAELNAAEARRQAEVNKRLAYSANQRFIQLSHELQGESSLASEMMITGWIPDGGERDLRGWEWYFNYSRIHSDEKSFHLPGPVTSLDFAPDGEMVAASGPQGTEIRNTLSGALVRRLAHGGGDRKCIWSPAGDRVLTVTRSGDVQLWNPATGEKRPLQENLANPVDLDWKGQVLVTLHEAGLRCWRFDGKSEPALEGSIASPETGWHEVALSPDGRHLAVRGENPILTIWERPSLDEPLLRLEGAASALVALDWKPDGRWIAASTKKNAIRIWEVPSGQRVGRIGFKEDGPIRDIAWNSTGDQIALINPLGQQVDVFDLVASGGEGIRGFTPSDPPQTLAWSRESYTVAIGGKSGLVALVRHGLPKAEHQVFKHAGALVSLNWTPDGSSISCLGEDQQLFRVDSLTGKASEPLKMDLSEPSTPFAWNPESGTLALARGKRVEIVARQSGPAAPSIDVAMPEIAAIVWLDGRNFLACGPQGEIERVSHEADTGQSAFERPDASADTRYHTFSASPDGRHLLGTGGRQRLTLWNVADGRILLDHTPPSGRGSETCHAWAPDGGRFATGNDGGVVSFWKPGSADPIRRIPAHRGPVLDLAWHPRGDRLASAGSDGLIRISDPETGEMLLSLRGYTGPVHSLAWSPDARRLASCGEDGTIRIWDASAGYLLSAE
ncbi:MAG: WD40 repeat domain-containing serine/threonine protein kinase [Haloferula sp.]